MRAPRLSSQKRPFESAWFMPPPQCAKCRGYVALEGDSWCIGCTAWESLGRELSGHWDSAGARQLANDLAVSCVRQVRAVRSLSSGLIRTGSGRAGESRADRTPSGKCGPSPAVDRREPLERRPHHRSREAGEVKEETSESSHYSEDEEEEEDQSENDKVLRTATPKTKARSPRRISRKDHSQGGEAGPRAGIRRASVGGEKREEGKTKRRKSSGYRRAGRKHQRLARLAENPNLLVHRKA